MVSKDRKGPNQGRSHPAEESEGRRLTPNIFHSIEVVEKAVIGAVRDEVGILFLDRDHEHTKSS